MTFPQAGARLALATHNPGKVAELRAMLAPQRLDLVDAATLGLPEPEETGATFAANAALKARAAARASGIWALADDSGLAVDALDGAPGPLSARWGGPERDFRRAREKVADALRARAATFPAPARFECVLALAAPDGATQVWFGACHGAVIWPPRGAGGFGYDPMFVPQGADRTFAETASIDKARLSHRAAAMRAMREDWRPAS